MAVAKLPTAQPALADFFGEVLGIPKNEWTVNGAITAVAAVPFSLVVNEAIDAGVATVGKLTTSNGEILNYNAVNTATKTFTVNARAQEGTTAAAIDNGSAVGQYLTRDQVNQLIQEVIQMSKTGAGAKGANVASAAALNIGEDGWYFAVTGTTTITSIEARLAGQEVTLRFDGALTLTHNATSLILQGATNLTTAAGDVLTFVSEGSGNWREKSRRLATPASGGYTQGARVFSSVALTATSGVELVLAFDSERYDTDTIHDNVTNNSRLTCKTAGKYLIVGNIRVTLNNTGYRVIRIRLNGTTYIASAGTRDTVGADGHDTPNPMTIYDLAVNDYVELTFLQNSGVGLQALAEANATPEFSMQRIG